MGSKTEHSVGPSQPIFFVPFQRYCKITPRLFSTNPRPARQRDLCLDLELSSGGALDVLHVGSQGRLDRATRAAVLVDNLDAAANVEVGLEHAVQLAPDGLEELVVPDPVNQVVGFALRLSAHSIEGRKGARGVQELD
jgi:hypothetical protein